MTAAEATVNEGGVIIMVAESSDGHCAPVFYETFRNDPDEILAGSGKKDSKVTVIPDGVSVIVL